MEEAVSVHPALAPQLVHWIRGVFLVTSIDPGDDGDDVRSSQLRNTATGEQRFHSELGSSYNHFLVLSGGTKNLA